MNEAGAGAQHGLSLRMAAVQAQAMAVVCVEGGGSS